MKKSLKFLFSLLLFFSFLTFDAFWVGQRVLAQTTPTPPQTGGGGILKDRSGIDDQVTALSDKAGFEETATLPDIIATIVQVLLSLLGIIFVILIIVSGYQWMTAGGNEEQVTKSKKRMTNAIIGLVIVLAAFIITAFVFRNLPLQPSAGSTGGSS